MEWFSHEGHWHAATGDRTARCGLELVEPPHMVVAPEDEMPPAPCRSCLMAMFRDECVDEPLEAAKARGFVPVDP